jgi:hypothetical protein
VPRACHSGWHYQMSPGYEGPPLPLAGAAAGTAGAAEPEALSVLGKAGSSPNLSTWMSLNGKRTGYSTVTKAMMSIQQRSIHSRHSLDLQ